ncbi:hypothetical protein Val02_16930 [Virgisporangium aliadipatigenens]|uniref:5-formyltetrahydrofolate cyclo-ligase n=1 Tax=Virgisporangium aliadipatigenens TaxID=741659 RepID=A0A8J3YI22_9ACTN|nr:hypothetical protein [Virgisporangium aliadipatigenens]GIJ44807.1 hypothetical protein Val02_16930 [Virgisporangium aliadipatigenens]
MTPDIDRAKQRTRDQIWALLERHHAAPPGVHGHIPDFEGAGRAAARLADLDVRRRARTVESNLDMAQLPARVRALRDRKLLYMAVPRLAEAKPFYMLEPAVLSEAFEPTGAEALGYRGRAADRGRTDRAGDCHRHDRASSSGRGRRVA